MSDLKPNYKQLVLNRFPELTVKRDPINPKLFIMLNSDGELFTEKTTAYSASKTWNIAYILMQKNELQPDWKKESERKHAEFERIIEERKQSGDLKEWPTEMRDSLSAWCKQVCSDENYDL